MMPSFLRLSTHGLRACLLSALMTALFSLLPSHALAQAKRGFETVRFQSLASDRAEIGGRLFRPAGRKVAPAVILMHGCGGWQPEVLAALDGYAKFLSANGFVVLNLDSFSSRNRQGGRVCASLHELERARGYRTQDAFAALQFLRHQNFVDGQNIFLVGQSNGGSVALIAALNSTVARHGTTGFRGVVALYPWCGATGGTRLDLHSPLLVLGGGKDDWVPIRDCTRFVGKGQELSVRVYPNAAHSYDLRIPVHRYLGNLVGYHPQAAAETRSEMLAFFRRHAKDTRLALK